MTTISTINGVTNPPIATRNMEYRFDMEEFLLDESESGVKRFEFWYANRPDFKLSDGDWCGYTLLMHAVGAGNILLVKRLVEIAEQKNENINTLSSMGMSVFDAAERLADGDSETSKVVECVKILINAGADINIPDRWFDTPLDSFVDRSALWNRAQDRNSPDFKACERLQSLIKLFSDAGAKCNDKGKNVRTKSRSLLKAQQEHLDLEKMELLYFAKKNPDSTVQDLPPELFSRIAHAFWDQNY
jgi:hypothetical protein